MGIFHKVGFSFAAIVIFGIAVMFWGFAFNQLALVLNDGKMPVVITERYHISSDERHKVIDATTRGIFFIDWIPIHFNEIKEPNNTALKLIYKNVYGKFLNYPIEGGMNYVSIGDLMIWFGASVFLLFLGPLILMIPFTWYETRRENGVL